jgi:hypothetical protein
MQQSRLGRQRWYHTAQEQHSGKVWLLLPIPHLLGTLLQRTGFWSVHSGWDAHLGKKGATARGSRVSPNTPVVLAPQPALTWMTTPMTGRFRVCPGTGAGHWSISLQTVDTDG